MLFKKYAIKSDMKFRRINYFTPSWTSVNCICCKRHLKSGETYGGACSILPVCNKITGNCGTWPSERFYKYVL